MGLLDSPKKPEYDFARERWNEFMFQPSYRLEIKMRAENIAWAFERLFSMSPEQLEEYADRENGYPALLWVAANTILTAGRKGDYKRVDAMLDRIIGSAPVTMHLTEAGKNRRAVTFSEFCETAGYPNPFPKQIEMMEFGMREPGAKLMLGSRGYGKTDYVVILGIAWSLFNDPTKTFLVVTKSESRNKGIMKEIQSALDKNNVVVRHKSGLDLSVEGQKGKDPSVSLVTIGSRSFRGRHPYAVIMDDPVTPEDAGSLAARTQAQTLYYEVLKLTSNVLVIGQPAHRSDLYADLRPRLKSMEVPHGTIEELDHDLEAMKLAGVSIESIQMSYHLRIPITADNPLHGVQFVDSFTPGACVAFIDPSFEGGDYTAMTVVKQYFDGVMIFGKVWKRAWYDLTTEFREVVEDLGVGRIAIEINALGEQPVLVLRQEIPGIGVVGWRSVSNKHARIMALGPFAKYINIAKDSDVEYIRQVKDYEYGIENDDAPDSLASALEWIGLIKGNK